MTPQIPSSLRPGAAVSATVQEWRSTFALFGQGLKRWFWAVFLSGLIFAGMAAAYRHYSPVRYPATAQLLFDPRGLKVFNNDLTSGYHDANAAISYVESQMGVIQSERVLSRVMGAECDELRELAKTATHSVYKASGHGFTRFCPREGWDGDWQRGLQEMRRVLTVKRVERSYVVDVTATGATPQLATSLASAVVNAYIQEEAATRAETINRLTGDLSGRLSDLRKAVKDSEDRLDHYRRDKNLLRVGDRLIVETSLATATAALNESQTRIDRARARMRQIETAARNPSALGALGAEADTRQLLSLYERRSAVMAELAPLFARAGPRHPALIDARSRVAEIDRAISHEMSAIRVAARSDLSRSEAEQGNLSKTVSELTVAVATAKQSEIALRELEQSLEANRKVLESFETRMREAREYGKLDSANLRIVSVARSPLPQNPLPKLLSFALLGWVLGIVLAVVGVAIWALVQSMRHPPHQLGGNSANPAYALQMRAEAFARYRYG